MSDFSRILEQIEAGNAVAADELLRLVYGELHAIAKVRLRGEKADLTLQATELVNEAYLRIFGKNVVPTWENRAHFFGAASEAMRRILVDHARRKHSQKRGGHWDRIELLNAHLAVEERRQELLAIHDALDELERCEKQAAQLVKLRYFIGMEHREAAETLGITKRVADRLWVVAKAWLFREMGNDLSQNCGGAENE